MASCPRRSPGGGFSLSQGGCRRAKPTRAKRTRAKRAGTLGLWACLLTDAGLLACDNPRPTLIAVDPNHAYADTGQADGEVRLTLIGDGFLPATILDPGSGRRIAVSDGFSARIGAGEQWQDLTRLGWQSTSRITATLSNQAADRLPVGLLDVELTDPRGETAVLPRGFQELGRDPLVPEITFTSPAQDALFAPGMLVRGSFHAKTEPPGRLYDASWYYTEDDAPKSGAKCEVPRGASEIDCAFKFTITPSPGAGKPQIRLLEILANATEDTPNRGTRTYKLSFDLRPAPTIVSVTPASGGLAGGTEVIIKGTGFLPGTYATLDDQPLLPDGGIIVDQETLCGYTPPHPAGRATLKVATPLGPNSTFFEYVAPPIIDVIEPQTGDPAGGTPVTIYGSDFGPATRIFFGPTLQEAVPLVDLEIRNNTLIHGYAPPGNGTTTVWAADWASGFTRLPDGFTWSAP